MKLIEKNVKTIDFYSVEKAKQHLNIDWDYDDELIGDILKESISAIEIYARASLREKTYKLVLQAPWVIGDSFDVSNSVIDPNEVIETGYLKLLRGPINSVNSVTLISPTGAETVYDEDDYNFNSNTGYIYWKKPEDLLSSSVSHIVVEYESGYKQGQVPDDIVNALKSTVAYFYENRGDTSMGLPSSIKDILDPYRYERLVQ